MNEHALDAMIYAWMAMKEKEENKMEGIFMGQIVGSTSNVSESDGKRCASIYFHDTESNACGKLSHYNKTYSLVLSDDVIKTNDELLKLRDELREIKTARNLREAYVKAIEQDRERLREERDRWKNRCNSVTTDICNALSANGIEFTIKDVLGDVNWKLEFDIPELNEAKAKVADLETKVKVAKANEDYWRGRKEEEEEFGKYWRRTFNAAVKAAKEQGVCIFINGENCDEHRAKVFVVNERADDLEKQVAHIEDDNSAKADALANAKNRGDYWLREHEVKAREYQELERKHDAKWTAMLQALKEKGVEVLYMGEKDGKPIIDIKFPELESDRKWVQEFAYRCGELRAEKFELESELKKAKKKIDYLERENPMPV